MEQYPALVNHGAFSSESLVLTGDDASSSNADELSNVSISVMPRTHHAFAPASHEGTRVAKPKGTIKAEDVTRQSRTIDDISSDLSSIHSTNMSSLQIEHNGATKDTHTTQYTNSSHQTSTDASSLSNSSSVSFNQARKSFSHGPSKSFTSANYTPLPSSRPTARFSVSSAPGHYSREALYRQIQLLTQTKNELIVASDARAKAYEVKIEGMQHIIDGLQTQVADLKQECVKKDAYVTKLRLKLGKTIEAGVDGVPATLDEFEMKDGTAISNLNFDLIRENTALREQIGHLKDSLESYIQQSLEATEDATREAIIGSNSRESSRRSVLKEVERILKQSAQVAAIKQSHIIRSTESQTDLPHHFSQVQSTENEQTIVICELVAERDHLRKSLVIVESKNNDLNKQLGQLRNEAAQLEHKFGSLMGETEATISAERVSRETIQDQKETIDRYAAQVIELGKQIETYRDQVDRLKEEHKHYKHAHSVLHHMTQVRIHHLRSSMRDKETIQLKQTDVTDPAVAKEDAQPDPVTVLEFQWMADRERFAMEIEMMQKTIENLERENMMQRQDHAKQVSTMHNEHDWAMITAKLTISEDECRRIRKELTTRYSVIDTLQTQIGRLEDKIGELKTDIRMLKDRGAQLRQEHLKKEMVYKANAEKYLAHENVVKQYEARIKTLGANLLQKASLIKDLRAKLEHLPTKDKTPIEKHLDTTNPTDQPEDPNSIHKLRQDLTRKAALVKHWKTKAESLDKELSILRSTKENLIDPKICETLQAHLRITKHKVKETETIIQSHERRGIQFTNCLYRLFTVVLQNQSNAADIMSQYNDDIFSPLVNIGTEGSTEYNQDDVISLAKDLSKRILNVELTSVLRGSPIRSEYSKISVKEMTQRLDRILKSDVFEDEVVEFMKRIIKVE